jgi:putative phage-type endonuclease
MATTKLGLSEKQQAMRMQGIGASEIAAIVGAHPTKKPIDVWLEKTGQADPFEGNSLTEFGHRIERVIGEAWAERHPGLRVYTPGTLRHPEHPIALASPDRVVAPAGLGRPPREQWLSLLEIKTVFFSAKEYGEGEDEVPERHLLQVQWQEEVCNVEEAELVALVNGDYRPYPIHRDRELGGMLIEAAERFWTDHVVAGVPPAVDGSDSYGDFLSKRFAREKAPLLPATPEAAAMAKRLREARAVLKAAEAEEALAAQLVKAALGEALGFEGLCTWKANKDGTKFDVEHAVEGFLCLLEEEGFGRERARALWAKVVQDFTTTKPGARVLRLAAAPKE